MQRRVRCRWVRTTSTALQRDGQLLPPHVKPSLMWAESMATSRTVSRGGVLFLCSRDRSRVYGNCSTTTARFVRVAITIYFYTHEKGVKGTG
eukprot:scaffold80171_cov50-Phaeocystis_antarctica.AAC.1